jgi:hypothetical protein
MDIENCTKGEPQETLESTDSFRESFGKPYMIDSCTQTEKKKDNSIILKNIMATSEKAK